VIHAAGESALGPLPPATHAIALSVPDEAALLGIEARLREARVPHVAIREPDPPWCGALMAVGVCPAPKARLRPFLRRLPLLKGDIPCSTSKK